MKKSKMIATALCLIMATTASGCQGGNSADTETPTPGTTAGSATTTAAPQAAQSDDPYAKYAYDPDTTYEIEWCVNLVNAPTDEDASIKLLFEEKYNVKFNIWYVDRSNREELLNIRFTSGAFPDVLTADGAYSTANYQNQGLIMELPEDMVEHFMPRIYENIREIEALEGVDPFIVSKVEGKNYGIPNFNYAGKYHFTGIWRQDWLDVIGIDKVPETIEEFDAAFYAVKENKDALIAAGVTTQTSDNIYALSSGYFSTPFASIYGAFGYQPSYWAVNDQAEMVYGAIQPEMKEALAYLSRWYADGILNPEFVTGENRGDHWSISHDFVEGRIIYSNNGPFYTTMPAGISVLTKNGGKMTRAYSAVNDPETMVSGRPPIGPDGESGSVVWGMTTGDSVVFSKKLEDQPDKLGRVLTMIEDMCTDQENWVLMNYGIEGEHWQWVDGVRSSEGLLPEEDLVEKYGLSMVFPAWAEGIGLAVADDPAYYEYAEEVARYTSDNIDASYGISFPSTTIYWDEIDKLQKQVYNDIITGKRPLDDFDQFVQDWLNAGGEQITKEANEWYSSTK